MVPALLETRFHTRPRMNTANSGALKKLNRVCRYVMMLPNWLAIHAVSTETNTPMTVMMRPVLR